ncbi:Myeloblastin [Myotis brandtii]|uniref:Myeloblastin n=1 Tax=Myotis brandtii TaxID=109478 RepID=S7PJ50_MYOBR|nr:Myeloblastin [Myotis brandtii]
MALVRVVLGAHNLRNAEPSQQKFSVTRQFSNNYDPELKHNDILLLQLDHPANLTAQVAVAQLPEQDQLLPHGTQCLAMGWGRLGTMEPLPHVLQELNVTVVTFLCRPENVCTFVPRRKAGICFVRTCPAASALGLFGWQRGLQELPTGGRAGVAAVQTHLLPTEQLQAVPWSPVGKRGAPIVRAQQGMENSFGSHRHPGVLMSHPVASGDSGGPLICDGVLQAVDSFLVRECANRQYPDFYARVALYVDWIQSVLRSVGGEGSS